jgi:hypothetical protein
MTFITDNLRPLDEQAFGARDGAYEPLAIDVLRVHDGVVTEIVTFGGAVFEHFDLPATLSAAVGTR